MPHRFWGATASTFVYAGANICSPIKEPGTPVVDTPSSPSYKAFFLGPKSENEAWVRAEIQAILGHWFRWRKGLFTSDPEAITKKERREPGYLEARENLSQHLEELNDRLAGEIPKYSPRYIGHMVSELALPAILGHLAALLHNPNNTVREVSRVGSDIEIEAVAMLAEMLGYDPAVATGHITGGGTVANFEGLWRARYRLDHWLCLGLYLFKTKGIKLDLFEAAHMGWPKFHALSMEHDVFEEQLRPLSAVAGNPFRFAQDMSEWHGRSYRGPVVMVPGNKHFSWSKGINIFGLGEEAFWQVPLDANGKMSVSGLKKLIDKAHQEQRPVLMVVSVAGTTETGEIDPVDQVQDLLDDLKSSQGLDIWHHVDAAYGGFLCAMLERQGTNSAIAVLDAGNTRALQAISRAHSVTIDPHKLGYVPYSCGAFLVHDREAYAVASFHAP
jgi:glutamate/tyrosine decarboxylase-like PLP-dependent enzyme